MKKNRFPLLVLAMSLVATHGFAQNIAINEDGGLPNPNAILDIKSFTKGLLIPRVSTSGRLAIPNTKGLLVYDTTASSFWFNTGSGWQDMTPGGAAGWSLNGNSGTDASNFLGTTDNRPLIFKVNNQVSGLIDPTNFNTYLGGNVATFNTGADNTVIGDEAMFFNTSGSNNTALGSGAMLDNTTGFLNTAVGAGAMSINTTGFANTIVGVNANLSTGNLFNATAIGEFAIVNASNKVRIGNSLVTSIEGQVPFTTPSDGRFKYKVQEDVKGLDFILQLRPVTYQFDVKRFDEQLHRNVPVAGKGMISKTRNSDYPEMNKAMEASYDAASAIRRSGFIAQEVEKAAVASGYDFSGIIKPKADQDHYSLSYESFVVPLVKAVQEQQRVIADLGKQVAELKKLVQQAK